MFCHLVVAVAIPEVQPKRFVAAKGVLLAANLHAICSCINAFCSDRFFRFADAKTGGSSEAVKSIL